MTTLLDICRCAYAVAGAIALLNVMAYIRTCLRGQLTSGLPSVMLFALAWLLTPGSVFLPAPAATVGQYIRGKLTDAAAWVATELVAGWVVPALVRWVCRRCKCLPEEPETSPLWWLALLDYLHRR
jgi:hypothetical protein